MMMNHRSKNNSSHCDRAPIAAVAVKNVAVPRTLSPRRLAHKVPRLGLGVMTGGDCKTGCRLDMTMMKLPADKQDDKKRNLFEKSNKEPSGSWTSKAKKGTVVPSCSRHAVSSQQQQEEQKAVVNMRVILKDLQQQGQAEADATATAKEKHVSFATTNASDDGAVQCCIHIVDRVQEPNEVANYWYSKQEKNILACEIFYVIQLYRQSQQDDSDGIANCDHDSADSIHKALTTAAAAEDYRKALVTMMHQKSSRHHKTSHHVLARHYDNGDDDDNTDGPRGLERIILQEESAKRAKKHLRRVLKAQRRHRPVQRQCQQQQHVHDDDDDDDDTPPLPPPPPLPPSLLTEDEALQELRDASLKTSVISQRFSLALAQYDATIAAALHVKRCATATSTTRRKPRIVGMNTNMGQ